MAQTIQLDKIASVVYRLGLSGVVNLSDRLESRSGHAVVVRVLPEGKAAQEMELADGRSIKVFGGDVIVGALGRRRALRGFVGDVPARIHAGDHLAILNRGGVIGAPTSGQSGSGPLPCEVIGMPLLDGRIPNLMDYTIPHATTLEGLALPPVAIVSGTSMESGKTSLLTELVQSLSKRGIRVAAGKLTGVACLRDLLAMQDNGAVRIASFQDAGHASTAGLEAQALVETAKSVIAYLAESTPDVILLELGDGLVGDYGVTDVLTDPEIRRIIRLHAFCANDLAGAWGGLRFLEERGLSIDVFSGPVTDNLVGVEYLESQFNRPAINACRYPARVAEVVLSLLKLNVRSQSQRVREPQGVLSHS